MSLNKPGCYWKPLQAARVFFKETQRSRHHWAKKSIICIVIMDKTSSPFPKTSGEPTQKQELENHRNGVLHIIPAHQPPPLVVFFFKHLVSIAPNNITPIHLLLIYLFCSVTNTGTKFWPSILSQQQSKFNSRPYTQSQLSFYFCFPRNDR